ncbi:hypothetical protein QFC19_008905 [Naganishia cerealis]|uniref:Uncharacterized protein n=1 Tax=Naganishia cerealis TaxID=610337 RepID=A0ACC2UY46_9TREE|nr:hypothetical protein QFC19_008905 [Naganishia cerealis]
MSSTIQSHDSSGASKDTIQSANGSSAVSLSTEKGWETFHDLDGSVIPLYKYSSWKDILNDSLFSVLTEFSGSEFGFTTVPEHRFRPYDKTGKSENASKDFCALQDLFVKAFTICEPRLNSKEITFSWKRKVESHELKETVTVAEYEGTAPQALYDHYRSTLYKAEKVFDACEDALRRFEGEILPSDLGRYKAQIFEAMLVYGLVQSVFKYGLARPRG